MSKYKTLAVTTINKWIGDFLEEENVMAQSFTVGGVQQPSIMPGGQTPEAIDGWLTGPERAPAFMVYGLELDQHDNDIVFKCEKVSYTIFAPTVSKVLEILAAIKDLTGREDWSAEDANMWADDHFENQKPFHIFYMEHETVAGATPLEGEGGRYAAIVNIHYHYTHPIDDGFEYGENGQIVSYNERRRGIRK